MTEEELVAIEARATADGGEVARDNARLVAEVRRLKAQLSAARSAIDVRNRLLGVWGCTLDEVASSPTDERVASEPPPTRSLPRANRS